MFKSPRNRRKKDIDGKRASDGVLASIDSILGSSSSHSIKSLEELDDDELEEDNIPDAPNAELAKKLQPIPASPGVFNKRKSLGSRKSRRARALKDSKKMGGSLSAIESLLGSTDNSSTGERSPGSEQSSLSTPSSKSSKLKRKSSKKKLQALTESRETLPPFQDDHLDEDDEILVEVKDPKPRRSNSMGHLSSFTSEAAAGDETASRRARRTLSNSLHSGMKSSVRRNRSSGVETSSRRGKRSVDVDSSSRRSRRTLDTTATDGGSSRRSRRTLDVDGNSKRSSRKLDTDSSSRRSKRSVMVDDDGSSRRSRRTLNSDGSLRSLKSKTKKKKNKSKRRSSESYTSNSTSVTADMDESWASLINSQRDDLVEEDKDETTEQECSLGLPLGEEPAKPDLTLPEEREYELPLPQDDKRGLTSPLYNDLNNSLHFKSNRSNTSSSSLDLDEEEDDEDAQIVQEKKKELPKFLAHASLGDIGFDLAALSSDDDSILVPDTELPSITEEVARPPSSRRSITRETGGSRTRRGLSCGPTRSFTRGREEDRSNSKRGFSISPERHVNEEAMDIARPLLSCMKGSRGKYLSVKLKNPHVYFNECLVITPIIPTYELATKKSDLWFRQKDFDKILNRSMAIALRVKEGKKTRKCVRGLEHFLKDKEERYAAWNAVLVEQEIQNLSGNHSDERISDLYLAASTTCRTEAQERAQDDYDAIVRYILEDC